MKTLTQSDLRSFTGTENYYNHGIGTLKIILTDGTKYLAEQAGAYWLMDIVLSYQIHKKIKHEPFQVWTLKNREKDWLVTCDDGNDRILVQQVIEYSDFPLDSIKLYYTEGVLMLQSEY